MGAAIAIGAVVGAIGFAPLIFGSNQARKASPTSNLGHAGALLLGVLGSFVVLVVPALICIVMARDLAVPFVLAEAGALVIAATAFGVSRLVRR